MVQYTAEVSADYLRTLFEVVPVVRGTDEVLVCGVCKFPWR